MSLQWLSKVRIKSFRAQLRASVDSVIEYMVKFAVEGERQRIWIRERVDSTVLAPLAKSYCGVAFPGEARKVSLQWLGLGSQKLDERDKAQVCLIMPIYGHIQCPEFSSVPYTAAAACTFLCSLNRPTTPQFFLCSLGWHGYSVS
jgi:hypothetical protein